MPLENNVSETKKKNKTGLIVIIALIAAACILAVVFWFMNKGPASSVVIKVDGNVVKTVSINQNQTINVEGYNGGYNIVNIENGVVDVREADCDNQICVNSSTITKPGQTITCIPHRVIVEIVGGSDGVDSVVN